MPQNRYEIWCHEESRSWKAFREMSEDMRSTLTKTGWILVVTYGEPDARQRQSGGCGTARQADGSKSGR